ncbi:hypothetical protein MUP32_05170 [Candidatus Microgenomates bacterium]|nr:hypothetical protein [Candidatus Microgenomates bacterium]
MTKKLLKTLPQTIKVKIEKTLHGKYFAELPEYDVFTEANNREELDFLINDLIYCLFDIPRQDQKNVWYRPKISRPTDLTKVNTLNMFIVPSEYKSRYCV